MAMPYALRNHSCTNQCRRVCRSTEPLVAIEHYSRFVRCITVAFKRRTFILCNSKFMI